MKVLYKYNDEVIDQLQKVDKAIKLYREKFKEELIRNTTKVTNGYFYKCLQSDEYMKSLLNLKAQIMNRAVPRIIIIKSDDGTDEIEVTPDGI